MAEAEKRETVVKGRKEEGEEEEERLMEGMAVLDFDMLCSTVAMQTHGKWSKGYAYEHHGDDFAGELGGVFRMWEGDLLDCFADRRIAFESSCCPCYRFGKNMRRAGFGYCFVQGVVYLTLAFAAMSNFMVFFITQRHCFLYLGIAFTVSVGIFLGFYRTQIKKRFNIMGSDSSIDDCVYHLVCPCCTLSQESRTLEINNVQDGTWHGRGDTICIGSYGEASKTFFELSPPPIISTMQPNPTMISPKCPGKSENVSDHSWTCEVVHSESLIPTSQ